MGNIYHSETPDKESFSRVAKFYKIDDEIFEDEQKMYVSFRRVRGLGYMTFPEMLETMHENDLFDMLPVFSNAVHILGVIPFTLCSAERSFSVLHRLKTYLRSTMGNNREFKIPRLRTTTTVKHATVHDQNHVTVHFSRVVLRLR